MPEQSPVVLALDQGSSSTRCVAYDARLRPIASGSAPVSTARPGPGMVEHDPEELFRGVLSAVASVREECGGAPVAALGIANQTETFAVWDTGDRRGGDPGGELAGSTRRFAVRRSRRSPRG